MSGFVGGTLVKIPEFPYAKPIKDIQVGDYVMSIPENGIGEPVPKRVLNTFHHKDKEIWYLGIGELGGLGYKSTNLGVTPNHPFMVYGYTTDVRASAFEAEHEDFEAKNIFYDEPRWKRVDQLRVGDIVRSKFEDKPYYIILSVKPFYKSCLPYLAYLQGDVDMNIWQSSTTGSYWRPNQTDTYGQIQESVKDTENRLMDKLSEADSPKYPWYDDQGYTGIEASGIAYPIFTTDVYNIEVEDYHTYCVDNAGILISAETGNTITP